MTDNTIRSYRIEIPQSNLDDLRERLAWTRLTDRAPGGEDAYGVGLDYVQRLAEYWRSGYDWRAWEARLKAYRQFITTSTARTFISCMYARPSRTRSRSS